MENRNNTAAFEPAPDIKTTAVTASSGHDSESSEPGIYTVKVNGNAYLVEVMEGGELTRVENQVVAASPQNASGG